MSFYIRTVPAASREASDMIWNGQEMSEMVRIGEVAKIALRASKDCW